MISGRMAQRLGELKRRLVAQTRLYGDPGRPTQIHICPTDRCNLTCRQCDIWRIRPARELDTAEWKRVLDELVDLAGAASLNFAGGEPFLRRDLPELIEYSVGLGLTVSTNTNGLIFTEELARRLHDVGLDILYVSLDGAREETHDHMRNRPGTYKKVMKVLEIFSRLGRPRVVLASILHRYSIPEAVELFELARSFDCQIVYQPIMQTFSEPFESDWYRSSEFLPNDFPLLDQQLDRLIEIRNNHGGICNEAAQLEAFKAYFRAPTLPNGLRCKAGFKDISFDPYGNVMMCYHLHPVGNVLQQKVADIWWGVEAALRRQEVVHCPRTCNLQNCNFDRDDV